MGSVPEWPEPIIGEVDADGSTCQSCRPGGLALCVMLFPFLLFWFIPGPTDSKGLYVFTFMRSAHDLGLGHTTWSCCN